jgi:hypothetical protein
MRRVFDIDVLACLRCGGAMPVAAGRAPMVVASV